MQEQFGFVHILNHYQDVQLSLCLYFLGLDYYACR